MNSTELLKRTHASGHDGTSCFVSCWQGAEPGIANMATSARSELHGPAHWRSVALAGAKICRSLPESDLMTVLLFAITHDACRISDDEDPEHGYRAADSLDGLLGSWADDLTPWRRELLTEACRFHADGQPADDPTIGACWDADRLCLWRGDTEPAQSLMSTGPGMSRSLILWARDMHLRDITWNDVSAAVQPAALQCIRCGPKRSERAP